MTTADNKITVSVDTNVFEGQTYIKVKALEQNDKDFSKLYEEAFRKVIPRNNIKNI